MKQRAANYSRAAWNDNRVGAERISDQRTGRFAVGGKGKRRVVVAKGMVVDQPAMRTEKVEAFAKANGFKPFRSKYLGDGGSLAVADHRLGLDVPASIEIAGAREQPEIVRTRDVGKAKSYTPGTKNASGLMYRERLAQVRSQYSIKKKPQGFYSDATAATEVEHIPVIIPNHIVGSADAFRKESSKASPMDQLAREYFQAARKHGYTIDPEVKRQQALQRIRKARRARWGG